ncbi:hypothetical protein TRFO_07860 [Tritrichomonas foetus]|uniref:C2 domain-containing protein n=1 Tax=Tritrichomonas foetus TaxID=1144522 RepID=A0A1J4JN40_9EUKA|nr:hypothetical protein TRFO_07860 [Tritrichomonas foetus]|eukprot:OHT00545.1 hypothetical protein TRFO_07860 [Tritrichomonas foetus]
MRSRSNKSSAKSSAANRQFVESGAANYMKAKYLAIVSKLSSDFSQENIATPRTTEGYTIAAELVNKYFKKHNLQLSHYSYNNETNVILDNLDYANSRLSLPKSNEPLHEFLRIMKNSPHHKFHDIKLTKTLLSQVPNMIDHSTRNHFQQILVRAGEPSENFSESGSYISQNQSATYSYIYSSENEDDNFSQHSKSSSSKHSSEVDSQFSSGSSSKKIKTRSEPMSEYSRSGSRKSNASISSKKSSLSGKNKTESLSSESGRKESHISQVENSEYSVSSSSRRSRSSKHIRRVKSSSNVSDANDVSLQSDSSSSIKIKTRSEPKSEYSGSETSRKSSKSNISRKSREGSLKEKNETSSSSKGDHGIHISQNEKSEYSYISSSSRRSQSSSRHIRKLKSSSYSSNSELSDSLSSSPKGSLKSRNALLSESSSNGKDGNKSNSSKNKGNKKTNNKISSPSSSKRSESSNSRSSQKKINLAKRSPSEKGSSSSLKIFVDDRIFDPSSSSAKRKLEIAKCADFDQSKLNASKQYETPNDHSVSSYHLVLQPMSSTSTPNEKGRYSNEVDSPEFSNQRIVNRGATIDNDPQYTYTYMTEENSPIRKQAPLDNEYTYEYEEPTAELIALSPNKRAVTRKIQSPNNNGYSFNSPQKENDEYTYAYETNENLASYTYTYESPSSITQSTEYTYTYDEPSTSQVMEIDQHARINNNLKAVLNIRDQMLAENGEDGIYITPADKRVKSMSITNQEQLQILPASAKPKRIRRRPLNRKDGPERKKNSKLSARKENVLKKITMLKAQLDELQSTEIISDDYSYSTYETKENSKIASLQQKLAQAAGKKLVDEYDDGYTYTYADTESVIETATAEKIVQKPLLNMIRPEGAVVSIQAKEEPKVEEEEEIYEEKRPKLEISNAVRSESFQNPAPQQYLYPQQYPQQQYQYSQPQTYQQTSYRQQPQYQMSQPVNGSPSSYASYTELSTNTTPPSTVSPTSQSTTGASTLTASYFDESSTSESEIPVKKIIKKKKIVRVPKNSIQKVEEKPKVQPKKNEGKIVRKIESIPASKEIEDKEKKIKKIYRKVRVEKPKRNQSTPRKSPTQNIQPSLQERNASLSDEIDDTEFAHLNPVEAKKYAESHFPSPKKGIKKSSTSPTILKREISLQRNRKDSPKLGQAEETDQTDQGSYNPPSMVDDNTTPSNIETISAIASTPKDNNQNNSLNASPNHRIPGNLGESSEINSSESISSSSSSSNISLHTVPNEESHEVEAQTPSMSTLNPKVPERGDFKVKIDLLSISNVPDVDRYCVLYIERGGVAKKTPTVEQGNSQNFSDEYEFDIGSNKSNLILMLKKEDLINGDKLIGILQLDLLEFPLNETVDQWYNLTADSGIKLETKAHLVIRRTLPKEFKLTVEVSQSRGFEKCSPFCVARISNPNNNTNGLIHQTTTIQNTTNPQWHENMEFSVSDGNADNLELILVNAEANSALAKVVLPLNQLKLDESVMDWYEMQPFGEIQLGLKLTDFAKPGSPQKDQDKEEIVQSSSLLEYEPKKKALLSPLQKPISPIARAIIYESDEELKQLSDTYSDSDGDHPGICPSNFAIPEIKHPEQNKLSLTLAEILNRNHFQANEEIAEEEDSSEKHLLTDDSPLELISDDEETIARKLDQRFGNQNAGGDVDFDKGENVTFNLATLVQNNPAPKGRKRKSIKDSFDSFDSSGITLRDIELSSSEEAKKAKITKVNTQDTQNCIIGDLGMLYARRNQDKLRKEKERRNGSSFLESENTSSHTLYHSNSAALSNNTIPLNSENNSSLALYSDNEIVDFNKEQISNSFTSLNSSTSISGAGRKLNKNITKLLDKEHKRNVFSSANSPSVSDEQPLLSKEINKSLKIEDISNNFVSTTEQNSSLLSNIDFRPKQTTSLNRSFKMNEGIHSFNSSQSSPDRKSSSNETSSSPSDISKKITFENDSSLVSVDELNKKIKQCFKKEELSNHFTSDSNIHSPRKSSSSLAPVFTEEHTLKGQLHYPEEESDSEKVGTPEKLQNHNLSFSLSDSYEEESFNSDLNSPKRTNKLLQIRNMKNANKSKAEDSTSSSSSPVYVKSKNNEFEKDVNDGVSLLNEGISNKFNSSANEQSPKKFTSSEQPSQVSINTDIEKCLMKDDRSNAFHSTETTSQLSFNSNANQLFEDKSNSFDSTSLSTDDEDLERIRKESKNHASQQSQGKEQSINESFKKYNDNHDDVEEVKIFFSASNSDTNPNGSLNSSEILSTSSHKRPPKATPQSPWIMSIEVLDCPGIKFEHGLRFQFNFKKAKPSFDNLFYRQNKTLKFVIDDSDQFMEVGLKCDNKNISNMAIDIYDLPINKRIEYTYEMAPSFGHKDIVQVKLRIFINQ